MNRSQRIALLEQLGRGEIPLREVAGLKEVEVRSLETAATDAYIQGGYEAAISAFTLLRKLEPQVARHELHLAFAAVLVDREREALEALNAFIERPKGEDSEGLIRARILRARIRRRAAPREAKRDLQVARALAAHNPALMTLVCFASRDDAA